MSIFKPIVLFIGLIAWVLLGNLLVPILLQTVMGVTWQWIVLTAAIDSFVDFSALGVFLYFIFQA